LCANPSIISGEALTDVNEVTVAYFNQPFNNYSEGCLVQLPVRRECRFVCLSI